MSPHVLQDLSAVLAAEYPQGLDIVYEGVGGAVRAAIMPHLAPNARLLQVGYISEYPHVGVDAAAPVEQGVPLNELFWNGKTLELDEGRKVIGQVWPKVSSSSYLHSCCIVTSEVLVVCSCGRASVYAYVCMLLMSLWSPTIQFLTGSLRWAHPHWRQCGPDPVLCWPSGNTHMNPLNCNGAGPALGQHRARASGKIDRCK